MIVQPRYNGSCGDWGENYGTGFGNGSQVLDWQKSGLPTIFDLCAIYKYIAHKSKNNVREPRSAQSLGMGANHKNFWQATVDGVTVGNGSQVVHVERLVKMVIGPELGMAHKWSTKTPSRRCGGSCNHRRHKWFMDVAQRGND